MSCCQCQGIEDMFNERAVSRELSQYHAKGPDVTTQMLVDTLKREGIQGLTLLDIGGGIGAIQHALLEAGLRNATEVDASQAYIRAARAEAQRRGLAEQVSFQHGDFVDLAAQIPPADIVTLDRVICCYPDMDKLVSLSLARASKLYGLVYPRDTWWLRIGFAIMNFFYKLQRNPYRAFMHPTRAVEAMITSNGFTRRFFRRTLVWQVAVYSR